MRPGKPSRDLSVRVPLATHEALVKAADERDVSVNYLVNRAIAEFLPRLIPVDEWRLTRD